MISNTFTFWQYTDGNGGLHSRQIPSIGRCDRDKFKGDLDSLKKLCGA